MTKQRISSFAGLSAVAYIFLPLFPVSAASLYFNPASPSGSEWSDGNQWSSGGFDGPFDANWTDGSTAYFRPEKTTAIDLAGDMVDLGKEGGLVNEASNDEVSVTIRSSVAGAEMVFDGSVINAGLTNARSVSLTGKISVSGDFSLVSGALGLYLSPAEVAPYVGTATVKGGVLFVGPGSVGPQSNIVTTENALGVYNDLPGEYVVGSVKLDAGGYLIGVADGSGTVQTTMGMLQSSGTAGVVHVRNTIIADGLVHALIVDQEVDSTYGGNLIGDNATGDEGADAKISTFTFAKKGKGNLTLNGVTIRLPQGTVISGGGLYFDDPEFENRREFDHLAGAPGSPAITVADGGTLGGFSTLRVRNGRSVVVEQGGALSPGSVGACGVTILELDSGRLDLLAAAGGAGWLRFDLVGPASSDRIEVTGGNLLIGDGKLDLEDFAFNCLPGCGAGEYILFSLGENANLEGRLGPKIEGPIARGFVGRLSVRDNQVVLRVSRAP